MWLTLYTAESVAELRWR